SSAASRTGWWCSPAGSARSGSAPRSTLPRRSSRTASRASTPRSARSDAWSRAGARTAPASTSSSSSDLHELEAFALDVAPHGAPVLVAARQERLCERVLDGLDDRALQRTSPEGGLVADLDEPHLGILGELEMELAVCHQLL